MTPRRDRNQDREALLKLAKELLSTQDYTKMLDILVRCALELLGADRGFLVLTKQDQYDYKVVRNWSPSDYEGGQEPVSRTIITEVLTRETPTLIEDASNDERFTGAQSVHRLKVRSVLAAPVLSSEGPLGVLYLESHSLKRFFTREELALFVELLAFSGRALEASLQSLAQAQPSSLARYQMAGIITQDADFLRTLERAFCVAAVNLSVLIQGQSGTGKELMANAIHLNSPRAKGPFIVVNCAAISPNLLESELFGHVKGAFTGATQNKTGLVAAAHQGTLFLDEIGELPNPLQAKLLRTLQSGEVLPVGGTQTKHCDVRFLAATNRNLELEIAAGNFREDLYYRLSGFTVLLPPLSERRSDIPLLFRAFLQRSSNENNLPIPKISEALLQALSSYAWPGNIRELENETKRLVALSAMGTELSPQDLSPKMMRPPSAQDAAKPLSMDEQKRTLIEHHLALTNNNRSQTAKNLGMSREGLRQLMKRLGLE